LGSTTLFSLLEVNISSSKLAAAVSLLLMAWVYVSMVVEILECPNLLLTVAISTPFAIRIEA